MTCSDKQGVGVSKNKRPIECRSGCYVFLKCPLKQQRKNTLGNMTSNYTTLIGAGLSIRVKICLGSDNIF
jgi:hypothetical protein